MLTMAVVLALMTSPLHRWLVFNATSKFSRFGFVRSVAVGILSKIFISRAYPASAIIEIIAGKNYFRMIVLVNKKLKAAPHKVLRPNRILLLDQQEEPRNSSNRYFLLLVK
jgi:hypothetical protein